MDNNLVCCWCGKNTTPLIKDRKYCLDCDEKKFKECIRCKRPFPDSKYFADINSLRCNTCTKRYEKEKQRRKTKINIDPRKPKIDPKLKLRNKLKAKHKYNLEKISIMNENKFEKLSGDEVHTSDINKEYTLNNHKFKIIGEIFFYPNDTNNIN